MTVDVAGQSPAARTTIGRAALQAEQLVKNYPSGRGKPPVHALDGLSLTVPAGTIFGLLGPNGAGKSTTVKILSTLSRADSGHASVLGTDVRRNADRVRRMIGLVSQKASSDPIATPRENLTLAGRLQGMSGADARARATELLARFALTDAADRQAQTLSGGMARKLDVAIGLMHRPNVLFLDEPTTGLDPEARSQMWAEIARLAAQDEMTVLLTTHYLDEADHLADRLAIIDRGRVVAEGTPDELKRELHGDTVQIELESHDTAVDVAVLLERAPELCDTEIHGTVVRARTEHGGRAVPGLINALDQAGIAALAVSVARPSLDDVYLRHAGRTFAEAAR